MKHVYMLLFDWSTTDDENVEVELFDNYDKAKKYFFAVIDEETKPETSWASEAFHEDGTEKEGYIFDSETDGSEEKDLFWNLTDKDDWNIHDFLSLRIMEVR